MDRVITHRCFLKAFTFILMLYANLAYCDGVKIVGSESIFLPSPKSGLFEKHREPKEIMVYKVEIDEQFKNEVRENAKYLSAKVIPNRLSNEDMDVNLGMGNVPVLDQGKFNTCSIFAMTGLLNAVKNAGDYISQQCLLDLGSYLSQYYGEQSGWEGANGYEFVDRINMYGAVAKNKCPRQYPNQSSSMDTQNYWFYSNNGQWSNTLSRYNLTKKNLEALKNELKSGHRMYIGTLLHKNYISGYPINGKKEGFWALPADDFERAQFIDDILSNRNIVGHGLVVTGYSDKHQYLKVRNSWSDKYGDSGEFYMSYDFYKLMNSSVIVVTQV